MAEHGQFSIWIITQYEILRELKAKHATTQIDRFEQLCQKSHVTPVLQDVVFKASHLICTQTLGDRASLSETPIS